MAAALAFSSTATWALDLESITLPDGFKITVYADGLRNARQMALGDKGTLFVGSRSAGNVYAAIDRDQDGRAEEGFLIDKGLNTPSGLAFRDGALYVGAIDRVLLYDGVEDHLEDVPDPVVITDSLPNDKHHGWKYLAFAPNGRLFVPVGAPCNVCEREAPFASILSMDPATGDYEVFASGVRNSVGFDFHPDTGEFWFTDNGRDMMGDDLPPGELNHAPEADLHFGFPHCHGGTVADPRYGRERECTEFTPPAQALGPHVAPLGMAFYTGEMFPPEYRNQVFIAEHGSWNRSRKIGYRISLVRFDDMGQAVSYEPFAEGWLQGQKAWGRPADVLVMPDGALLVSDDKAHVIYRISYGE
jgi:glucose/arabinose dehydrogenase